MVYEVKNGERIATINLDGTECAVKFSSKFTVFEVKNNGTAAVVMAIESGKASGEDGAVTIPSGESFCYPHMRNVDTVYLTGSGKCIVIAKNTAEQSFKSALALSGGGAIDSYSKTESDARYAQKSDIPASLPANGGNADTVDENTLRIFIPVTINRMSLEQSVCQRPVLRL